MRIKKVIAVNHASLLSGLLVASPFSLVKECANVHFLAHLSLPLPFQFTRHYAQHLAPSGPVRPDTSEPILSAAWHVWTRCTGADRWSAYPPKRGKLWETSRHAPAWRTIGATGNKGIHCLLHLSHPTLACVKPKVPFAACKYDSLSYLICFCSFFERLQLHICVCHHAPLIRRYSYHTPETECSIRYRRAIIVASVLSTDIVVSPVSMNCTASLNINLPCCCTDK